MYRYNLPFFVHANFSETACRFLSALLAPACALRTNPCTLRLRTSRSSLCVFRSSLHASPSCAPPPCELRVPPCALLSFLCALRAPPECAAPVLRAPAFPPALLSARLRFSLLLAVLILCASLCTWAAPSKLCVCVANSWYQFFPSTPRCPRICALPAHLRAARASACCLRIC